MDGPIEFESVETADLVGGAIALDFANTASAREHGPLREYLRDYADLVKWGERAGLITPQEGEALGREAGSRPEDAARTLERSQVLREAIYRVFSAQARGESPAGADLDVLTGEHAQAAVHRRLTCESTRVELEWEREPVHLDQLLWPVAQSAIELLVSDDRARVKECATENCNWLFLDASKNHSRRWCQMRECGNRAKARRHYARRKARG